MFESSTDIPEVEAHDPEPVADAIETARALFRSGEALDGLRWLRRAAERAEESGDDLRAVHLARSAADLSTALQSVMPSASSPSQPPSVAPPPSPPPAPSIAPHPIVPLAQFALPTSVAHVSQDGPPPPPDPIESGAPAQLAESPATTPSAPIPPSVPGPVTRRNDEAIALSPYDDFSDKTIVDAASPPIGRDALQSGVQITELPLSLGAETPRSVTMPSPPSSNPGLKAIISPLSSSTQPARRTAVRVAVLRNPERPGSWLALPLTEGSPAPEGSEEALLVSLQASSELLE